MKPALRAGIADDHPVVRTAVRMLLAQAGYRVSEVSNGNAVMSMLREHQPGTLVLDLNLPGLDGLGVLEHIRSSGIRCQVVVFTSLNGMFYQDRCMRAGAAAFVSKTNDLEHLRKAIDAVKAGYSYFEKLETSSVSLSLVQRSDAQLIEKLSNRELTICCYLANGMSNKAIAEIMHLSHKTVSTYKTRLTDKLQIGSPVHLRDFAKRNNLI
ncbi:Virulence factors putative positive transcription regulator BvgA [Pseudomonas fluorescens]|uniref:Virulence factors putative positive transcription regulator BvgA n=1 Tax=Pseudomonas fluorescens TaxID=294 RepID=A0A5E6Y5V3_PSEFL|nr:response regulator transcription factor [Pseudomonas fluorescens]VVN36822.1 Virulence factors putative positive transcription regulator BvgA [Pseudomonas fluorescens]VVN47899.1 Virulence factors putative positive transcription regulator BvgA [Pseudomonas fluorescens]